MRDRDDLFALGAKRLDGSAPLYLEFGVFEGASMRWWSNHLASPNAHLVGFDSFEGLPERWNEQNLKGRFSTGGSVPDIEDPRVRFVKGWFEDTVPEWQPPNHDRLFVNIDVDLYQSASTVLAALEDLIVPGTLLYFDELAERDHELRAFDEFLDATGMTFRVLGVTRTLTQWLLERTA